MFNPFHRNQKDPISIITARIASLSFKLFQENTFRENINFKDISQVEQDRIFNELIVTGLCIPILQFGSLSENAQGELRGKYEKLRIKFIACYPQWLEDLNVDAGLIDKWRQLIHMRVDEYTQEYNKTKGEFGNISKELAWVMLVAVGGYFHIRRGNSKPKDPVLTMITNYCKDVVKAIASIK